MSDLQTDTSVVLSPRSAPVVASMVPAAVMVVVVAVLGRGLWFFSDDWNMLAEYHTGNLLTPFNGHLSLVPAGIYQLLFHTVGVGSYVPFRVVGLLALVVLAYQVARLVEQRLAGARLAGLPVSGVVGALAVAAILWNSSGQMNLMFPFLMNFTIPIAALAAIWRHLDRETVRVEVTASIWLAVALATSGLGLMTAAAVGVELIGRRAPLRRWAILAPGPLLWSLWYLTHRDDTAMTTDVGAVASYAARMLLAAVSSIAAGWRIGGALLAVAFLGYLVVAAWRWRSLDGRLVGALVAPLAFAGFTAVTRIGVVPEIPPDELRYSWAIAAYLVLAAIVAARPEPWWPVRVSPVVWAVGLGVATAVLIAGAAVLVRDLREWNDRVSGARPGLSAILFSTEAVGVERVDPDRVIPINYVPVTAGGYLEGVAAVGSPIAGISPVDLGGGEDARRSADELLVEELPVTLEPVEGDLPTACEALAAGSEAAPWTLEVPSGSNVLIDTAGATAGASPDASPDPAGQQVVAIGRFGPGAPPSLPLPDGPSRLHVPGDEPAAAGSDETSDALPYRVVLPAGVRAARCG